MFFSFFCFSLSHLAPRYSNCCPVSTFDSTGWWFLLTQTNPIGFGSGLAAITEKTLIIYQILANKSTGLCPLVVPEIKAKLFVQNKIHWLHLCIQFGGVLFPPIHFGTLNQILLCFLGSAMSQQPARWFRQPPAGKHQSLFPQNNNRLWCFYWTAWSVLPPGDDGENDGGRHHQC